MTPKIIFKTKIRVNGQDYASVEEMPSEVRQVYERALRTVTDDKDAGLLNTSQTGIAAKGRALSNVKIVFSGREYTSVDQMPAEVRRLYEGIVAAVDANRNGIPDVIETGAQPTGHAQWQGGAPTGSIAASVVATDAVRSESTSSRLIIAGAVIAALLFASFVLGH